MEVFTRYPAEWLYIWLIVQAEWLVKLNSRPLPVIGFTLSHACFFWYMWAFRHEMAPLYGWHGRTSDNAMSSFGLILLAWLALAVVYLTKVLLLPSKHTARTKRQTRPFK